MRLRSRPTVSDPHEARRSVALFDCSIRLVGRLEQGEIAGEGILAWHSEFLALTS